MTGEGDDDLWEKVTKGITKLPASKTVRPAIPASRFPFTPSKKESVFSPPSSWLQGAPLSAETPSSHIDAGTAEKLKRGKFPIEARLDLHGYTALQAHEMLQQFILSCFERGKRSVLVITGKGLRPDGTRGVIRESVPRWLNEPEMRQRIVAFRYAKLKDGGEGALYVLLRRKR
jgi:DNA-nicking Smr family endonuclease